MNIQTLKQIKYGIEGENSGPPTSKIIWYLFFVRSNGLPIAQELWFMQKLWTVRSH